MRFIKYSLMLNWFFAFNKSTFPYDQFSSTRYYDVIVYRGVLDIHNVSGFLYRFIRRRDLLSGGTENREPRTHPQFDEWAW